MIRSLYLRSILIAAVQSLWRSFVLHELALKSTFQILFLLWSFVEILITVYVTQVFRLLRQFMWQVRYSSVETAVLIHIGQLVLKACKCFMM